MLNRTVAHERARLRWCAGLCCAFTVAFAACSRTPDDGPAVTIALVPGVTLRPAFAGGEFDYQTRVEVDGRGRYIVAPVVDAGMIAVYDSGGSFVMRIRVAEPGSNAPVTIQSFDVAGGDTIYVGDLKGRVYVLDPDGHQIRSISAPAHSWRLAALDGRIAAVRRGVSSDTAAPLVTADPTGSNPLVFGPRGLRGNRLRFVAANPARGTFWTVPEFGSEVQEFGSNGDMRATLDRSYEWLTEPQDQRRPGQVVDIAAFEDGALVIVTRRVGEITRRDIIDPPTANMPASIDPAAYARTHHFYLDYASATASVRLHRHGSILTGVARRGVVHGIGEDEQTGEWVLRTWRVSVNAPNR